MIIIIFPLFIMIHSPLLTRTLISSSSVWKCKFCVALKCLFHHVTSRLTAGGRHDKWQMNTLRISPSSLLSLSFFMPSQSHFSSRLRSQSITWLKNADRDHTITQASYYFLSLCDSLSLLMKVDYLDEQQCLHCGCKVSLTFNFLKYQSYFFCHPQFQNVGNWRIQV